MLIKQNFGNSRIVILFVFGVGELGKILYSSAYHCYIKIVLLCLISGQFGNA